jgi:arylsulfatase A-like enzyme
MPARRELHTGRYNFLHRSWGPLEPFDDSMPEQLKQAGVYTHLITDHHHYFADGGCTYHQRYNTWEFMRGQEGDNWQPQVADLDLPPDNWLQHDYPLYRQDVVNRQRVQQEEDWSQHRVFSSALDFLERNYQRDHWFLQIECFDPHEPFYAPQKYRDLYPRDYDGPHFDWPPYRNVQETEAEIDEARYEYAALVSMCDDHLGQILDFMDTHDMWDDTLLIVNTDHGILLGEHGWWLKNVQPYYQEVAHTPLFIWDPRSQRRGLRCDALVQIIDLAPTLLEYFGQPVPVDVQGHSLRETIASGQPVREAGLFGTHGAHVNLVTSGGYVYMRAPKPDNKPLYQYTLMPTHIRSRWSIKDFEGMELAEPFSFTKGLKTLKAPYAGMYSKYFEKWETFLWNVNHDPYQHNPLDDPELEASLKRRLLELMLASDAPSEQYIRLGLGDILDETG